MRLSILFSEVPLSRVRIQTIGLIPTLPTSWWDFSRSLDVKMTTGPHGLETLSGFLPVTQRQAEIIFLGMGTPTVYLNAGPAIIWKGRLEDLAHTTKGLKWTAYGPFRYFSDKLLTKIYSTQDISKMIPVTEDMLADYIPSMYKMDKNDRIFIALQKNNTYVFGPSKGAMLFYAPHRRDTIKRIEFTYDVDLPTNWKAEIVSYAEGFSSGQIEWGITTSGASTATVILTTARPLIIFRLLNQTGSDSTYTGETGAKYAKWTNVRFKNADNATVVASDIVADVLSDVEKLNMGRISSNLMLIEPTTEDQFEAFWEDVRADNVMRDLAATNDAGSPPTQYAVGMWGDELHFHPKNSESKTWFVNILGRKYERSLSGLANVAYALYRNAANTRTLRSANVADLVSQDKYDLVREIYAKGNTTSSAQAIDNRDMLSENVSDPPFKVTIDPSNVFLPEGGGAVPLWAIRAGDKLVVRNGVHLPGQAGQDYFEIGIARTELDISNMVLRIVPEAGSASLPMAIARRPKLSMLSASQRYQDPVRMALI